MKFEPKPRNDLEVQYRKWRDLNPEVFPLFVFFAKQMLRRNRRFGIGQLTERVRWEFMLRTTDEQGFKINNNFRAYIARELVRKIPELEELLEFRRVRAWKAVRRYHRDAIVTVHPNPPRDKEEIERLVAVLLELSEPA